MLAGAVLVLVWLLSLRFAQGYPGPCCPQVPLPSLSPPSPASLRKTSPVRCPPSFCLHPTPFTRHPQPQPSSQRCLSLIWTHLSSQLCVSSFPISQPLIPPLPSSSLSITSISSPSAPPSSAGTGVLGSSAPKIPSLDTLSTDLSLSLSSHLNIYVKIYGFLASCCFQPSGTWHHHSYLSPDTVLPSGAVDPRGLLSTAGGSPQLLHSAACSQVQTLTSAFLLPGCFLGLPCATHFCPGLKC